MGRTLNPGREPSSPRSFLTSDEGLAAGVGDPSGDPIGIGTGTTHSLHALVADLVLLTRR